MQKDTKSWPVQYFEGEFPKINFPEYQREPNVWSRAAKQRLVDSMLRRFDIASIYVYRNTDGSFDCIDGRQRMGAIMAFLGANKEDLDNGFTFKILNEVYEDQGARFAALDDMTFADIKKRAADGDKAANSFASELMAYPLTVIELSKSEKPEEFNLQFARLNLGTIINSGEKLHAMVGEMRDSCFGEKGLGQHRFLEGVRIPIRRYSKEQVAAQIVAQAFALQETKEYTRTRHFDLQKLFKEKSVLDDKQQACVAGVRATFDLLANAFQSSSPLSNRAITVTTVLFAMTAKINSKGAPVYAAFVEELVLRLRWQVGKGLDLDQEYRYLTDFQRHVTQASVEKPAVAARAKTFREQFEMWTETASLRGDHDYQKRTGKDPRGESRTA